MGHPKRFKNFSRMLDQLGDPSVPISVDNGIGLWGNCKQAWLLYDPTADFHVVLQDDAIICKNFKKLATEFIEKYNRPNRAFNFYFGTRANFNKNILADGKTAGFITLQRNCWGLAICLPTAEIRQMVEECDIMKHIPQDDIRIGRYLAKKKFDICYPMPSLIDHEAGESLVGDQGRFRKAVWFIDNDPRNNN